MRFRLKRTFRYQKDARTVASIEPGTYSVPGDITKEVFGLIRKYGKSEILAEKVAPENKVVSASESKQGVGASPVPSRSTRTKSKKRKAT